MSTTGIHFIKTRRTKPQPTHRRLTHFYNIVRRGTSDPHEIAATMGVVRSMVGKYMRMAEAEGWAYYGPRKTILLVAQKPNPKTK